MNDVRNSQGKFAPKNHSSYRDKYPTGRRHCTGRCRRWRLVTDFSVLKWADRERTVPLRLMGKCRTCWAEHQRMEKGGKPRNWYPHGKPGTALHRKRETAKLRANPDWLARHRRWRRAYDRARRRGLPGPDPWLPRKPFDEWKAECGLSNKELSRLTGLDEAFFRHSRDKIRLSHIDTVFTALGRPELVAILYGGVEVQGW